MKILLANKFFYLNGGSERVFFQERNFLINQGHSVIDFSMNDARNFSSPFSSYFVPNIDYKNAKGIWRKIKQAVSFIHSPVAVRNIERLLRQENPEIAHLHNIYHQLTPSVIPVLKKHGVKVVLTLHVCKLVCPSYLALKDKKICSVCEGKYFWKSITTNCQKSISQEFLLMIEAYWHKWKRSYEFVDQFIVPSQFIANLISRRISSSKIHVLQNGIDIKKFKPSYQDEGYGLYFGRISKEKGIETLLKAHRNIADIMPLRVVGTGPIKEKLIRNYPHAEFLGHKSGEELNDLIAKSAFVVVPSECYENCSMVVLEAMALGKPIIGSNVGGIPVQIEDGTTGLLFDMGNVKELVEKMKIMIENPGMRITFGKTARKKLENEYSLDTHCVELLKVYNELIAE